GFPASKTYSSGWPPSTVRWCKSAKPLGGFGGPSAFPFDILTKQCQTLLGCLMNHGPERSHVQLNRPARYLFDTRADGVAMQRPECDERLEDHQVKCALKYAYPGLMRLEQRGFVRAQWDRPPVSFRRATAVADGDC